MTVDGLSLWVVVQAVAVIILSWQHVQTQRRIEHLKDVIRTLVDEVQFK